MAKGQYLSSYQQKIVNRYYEHLDTLTIQKLSEAVSELYLATDARKAERLWASVATALEKTGANDPQVAKVLAEKNIPALAQLVSDIVSGRATPSTPPPPPVAPSPAPASPVAAAPAGADISADTLKAAFHAFKRRFKATKLDEESRLGYGPMSTGAGKGKISIRPPNDYPKPVWDELAKQGRIKYTGDGFYSLP